jgi:hypothetical protein
VLDLDTVDVAELRDCEDRECLEENGPKTAEPEQDGDHKYWACTVCGFEFGWVKIDSQPISASAEGHCAVGVPAELRRAASGVAEGAAAKLERGSTKVPLGLTIKKRPGL